MEVHVGMKVKCEQCGLSVSPSHLPAHVKRVHENVRQQYACTEQDCKKIFGSKATNTARPRNKRTVHNLGKVVLDWAGGKRR